MEFEVRAVTTIETCFVSLPLTLIQTLQSGYLPPVLTVELSSDARVWHVAWCGAASSSSSIEIARQYADCIGLSDGASVKVRVISNVPKAELVTCEPLTEDDWEILELNSELAETSILKQVGIVHEEMKFPLWLHGQTVVTFLVVSTIPQKPVVQLVPGSEVAVAPKRRKNTSLVSSDENGTHIKALLRIQDLENSSIYKHEENGMKMEVLPTSCVYIHPETAERYSFGSSQLVTISPRSPLKESLKMLHPKRSGMEKDAKDGNSTDTQDCNQLVLRLWFSKSVAKGHVMLDQSLCFYLGLAVHTWVYVKQCNISLKKDFSLVSLSPFHFKVSRNDDGPENSDLEYIKDHDSHRSRDSLQGTNSNILMGITDWSVHENFVAALSGEHSRGEVEETVRTGEAFNKFGHLKGISSLLRAWCIAQLASSSAENVNSLILGRKTLLHLRVKNNQLRRHAILQTSKKSSLKNRHQAEDQTFDILYILSLSEESMDATNAYELSFDKYDDRVITSRSLDALIEKLQLGDILHFSVPSQLNPDNNVHDVIPTLDWMGTAPVDVNRRLSILLSPTSGTVFHRYKLPLPGHILICGSPGSGKTLLAKVCAKSIEGCKDILAHVVFVSCSRLTLEKPSTIRQMLSRYISEALDRAPSIVIFDDLDSLIASSSDLEGSQPSSSSVALVEFLSDLLDEYADKRRTICGMGPISFLATAQSLTSFPPSLSSSGRFDFHIKLPVPAAAERSALLRHEIQKRSLQCDADMLSDIASKCDGYDAYDLEILVDRSVHAAVGRTLSSEKVPQENGRHDLIREDFIQAMKDFLPVAMRDLTKPATEGSRSGWDDVGGLNSIRIAIKEMIELPSKFPNIFAQAPLRLRSNVLLYGPPGCGKTHIVGAAAAACSLRFISVKGPELLNKYIGASEQAVRDIFSKAAAAAPCLLFFDEFDSIAPKRGHDNTGVTDRVVNQFLTELDGVEVLTGVFVFAATSRPDLLDAALLRPGRLDRLLFCDFPSQQERLDILKVLSRKLPMADDVELETISRMTEGFSGADLQALLSDAQLEAVHELLDRAEAGVTTEKKPVINDALLKSIAAKAKPSVSEAEKQRLYEIYNQFLDSKKSMAAQSRDAKGKKATLA